MSTRKESVYWEPSCGAKKHAVCGDAKHRPICDVAATRALVLTQLKLWVAVARYNFKWVTI